MIPACALIGPGVAGFWDEGMAFAGSGTKAWNCGMEDLVKYAKTVAALHAEALLCTGGRELQA